MDDRVLVIECGELTGEELTAGWFAPKKCDSWDDTLVGEKSLATGSTTARQFLYLTRNGNWILHACAGEHVRSEPCNDPSPLWELIEKREALLWFVRNRVQSIPECLHETLAATEL